MELNARKDVPVEQTWDLSLIFAEEKQMWDALEETKTAVKKLAETYAGQLTNAQNIVRCLDEKELIQQSISRIWFMTVVAESEKLSSIDGSGGIHT